MDQSNYSISSKNSSIYESNQDPAVTHTQLFVKGLLKSRIFLGRYIERRLVNKDIGYRDLVLVSAAETEFKQSLEVVQAKLYNAFSTLWIGVTDGSVLGNSNAVCIWTEIEGQPFGAFWFQVKSIDFRDNEVMVRLKCLRHISDSFLELEPILTTSAKSIARSLVAKGGENNDAEEFCQDFMSTLKGVLSVNSIKSFFTFVLALSIAVITGSVSLVNFLGNFILCMSRELSILVKNSTPLCLGFLDFIGKIFGGFYILMAMIFKQQTQVPITRKANYEYPGNHRLEYNNQQDFD